MTERWPNTPMEVLLVEDNPGDICLAEEAFAEAKVSIRLSIVRDGEAAHQFLQHAGSFAAAPRPDLILLDLNLPRKDGRELLSVIKADSSLRRIPVIVLTTSKSERDILRSYDLHANCYIIKPVGMDALIEVVRAIELFWFHVTTLPSSASASANDALS